MCTNVHVHNFSELVQPMNDHNQTFIKALYTQSKKRDVTRKARAEEFEKLPRQSSAVEGDIINCY
jgi:hypothetical protein